MTRVAESVTIERPVQEVWDYLMDSRNDAVWITNLVEVGRGGDLPVADGVEIEETFKFLGIRIPMTMKVTDHRPTTHSAVEMKGGPVGGRASYDLAAAGEGARLTMTLETDAHGFFKLTEPVFARMARRDVTTSLRHLKDVLEVRNDSRTHGP
jgi:carbon monoxide dehydrogenase subunit G